MTAVISRIRGGLGNQLFCYAAARRLAIATGSELVIDDVTGFARDHQYQRRYALHHFAIPCRRATASERMEPGERIRRGAVKFLNGLLPYERRSYLEQHGSAFDQRLLDVAVRGRVWLDGLWQGEGYFKDVEAQIQADLRLVDPLDPASLATLKRIRSSNSVAVHVRWFGKSGSGSDSNLAGSYYDRAVEAMDARFRDARYFIFSDDVLAAISHLKVDKDRLEVGSQGAGDDGAYIDLHLMSQCRHIITANSTFSWWGAWLGDHPDRQVITPGAILDGVGAWGFEGLLPAKWEKM